ncbi:protein SPT2 homolog isoform X2 [Hibiscus syriacus]|uniref:protein SPT2 homolog isoform X2 n=1 Tax=Hibiscus syriacus TaxID=106335 RepID=UPI001923A5B3|nr:protein SPT2 homolog isoform X2 [Hibiscus syriacus]
MRGYDREEVEDYDDYDMEGEYQDEDVVEEYGDEYEEEEEEEEEETRQPTQEEVEYLELRQRLKDSIRRKRKQSALASSEKKLPYNNFGSFFGPSQPVIAQRVIHESKSLLENQNLVSKMLSTNQSSKKNPASNSTGPKQAQLGKVLKPPSELRRKVEKLKVARDYSFLSDDTGFPAPAKDPPPRNVSAPTSEVRSAQMLLKSKQPLSSNNNSARNLQGIRDERKSVPLKGQLQSKTGTYNTSSGSKPNGMSMDSKKQLGVSSGTWPGRPVGASSGTGPNRHAGASNGTGPVRPVGASNGTGPGRPIGASNGTESGRPAGYKPVPSKMPIPKMEKVSAPTSRSLPPSAHKAPPSRVHSSESRQQLEQKRGLQERNKDKMMPQRPLVSSKPQLKKPVKQVSSHTQMKSNVQRPKKIALSEDEKALMMIRNMFHTDRYPVCDDDDVSDMEANWDEIMKEERRSAQIARKEDEEQLRLIEEEERRERMAKKRKLSRH